MAKDGEEVMLSFADILKEIAVKVDDLNTRKEALEAYADPIVDEARRRADIGGGVFPGATGKLAKNIIKEWKISNPNHIEIGWTSEGFYGSFHERGFKHAKTKKLVKNPHLRPAYHAKKEEGAQAAVAVIKKKLDPIE